ncbi:MAG TPA: transferrin-binding protein-like solute binding protein [Rhizomicrobium sp.]
MRASRLVVSVGVLTLAACGGGGSGGSPQPNTAPANNSTSNTPTDPPATNNNSVANNTPTVSIGAPDAPLAIASSQAFNFKTSPPPNGTVFGISGPAVKFTSTSVSPAGAGSDATATYRGTANSNGNVYPVFDLKVPALSLNATNLHGDGTSVTLADGGKVSGAVGTFNYTLLGVWTYAPAGGASGYIGAGVNGSATLPANVPATGIATYNGSGNTGGVFGAYFVPSGTGTVAVGTLTGNVSLTTSFTTNSVNGTMNSMMATPTDGSAATPWNTVSLSGSISRASPVSAGFGGAATVASVPANAGKAGFSTTASGSFAGAFYGPNAEEVGATWTLTDPNAAGGGKTAFGAFAATK